MWYSYMLIQLTDALRAITDVVAVVGSFLFSTINLGFIEIQVIQIVFSGALITFLVMLFIRMLT